MERSQLFDLTDSLLCRRPEIARKCSPRLDPTSGIAVDQPAPRALSGWCVAFDTVPGFFRFQTHRILKRVVANPVKNDRRHQGETGCRRGYCCGCVLRCIRFGRRPADKSATDSCAGDVVLRQLFRLYQFERTGLPAVLERHQALRRDRHGALRDHGRPFNAAYPQGIVPVISKNSQGARFSIANGLASRLSVSKGLKSSHRVHRSSSSLRPGLIPTQCNSPMAHDP